MVLNPRFPVFCPTDRELKRELKVSGTFLGSNVRAYFFSP